MTKKLLDKLGYNLMHSDYTGTQPWNEDRFGRGVEFCVKTGVKYLRPAFRLLEDEFDGAHNDWRIAWCKQIIAKGITPIWGPVPAGLQGHLKDSNYNELLEKAVSAYQIIMDDFIAAGISPNDFIFEGWNEADGMFAMKDGSAQTDPEVINNYLEFNMRICEECHKRGIRFMDFDSIVYPGAPEIQSVINQYNQKMAEYSTKPDWISFHPYCERGRNDNNIPEKLLVNNNMNLSQWNNLADIPLAVTEFGYPTEDWGEPFSGKYPYQYSKDMLIRQIIIQDYLNVDPIIIYSANTNADPSVADKDGCWGTYQYHKDTNEITLSTLGNFEYYWIKSMQGYHLNGMVTSTRNYTLTNENVNYTNFAFEYENNEGHKKLFYWNPFGYNTSLLNWNGNSYSLTFSQHVKSIES